MLPRMPLATAYAISWWKLWPESVARTDLFYGHIGGIDTLAQALLVAAEMVERGTSRQLREERYAGWAGELGTSILSGDVTLDELERRVATGEIDPRPVSGRQELLENLVNQQIWVAKGRARLETPAAR